MPNSQKTWWAPVWRGLVADSAGKHYRRIKGALWLLLYLILHAERKTGVVRHRLTAISLATGISYWTLREWLRRLRKHGYVTVSGTGRAPVIQVQRWRVFSEGHQHASLRGMDMPIRGAKTCTPEAAQRGRNSFNGAENSKTTRGPNNSIFTKVILRHNHVVKNFHPGSDTPNGRLKPRSREELLAWDLAEGLQDYRNLYRYLTHARRYPERVLRQLLSEALAVPEREIKRSRAALFEYLLNQHAKTHSQDSRH